MTLIIRFATTAGENATESYRIDLNSPDVGQAHGRVHFNCGVTGLPGRGHVIGGVQKFAAPFLEGGTLTSYRAMRWRKPCLWSDKAE